MLRNLSTALALFAATLLASAEAARAQDVVLSLVCDLGGAPAQMTMGVEYQTAFDFSMTPSGDISGIFPVGVTVFTAGEVVSSTARYSFRGENDFADFTNIDTNERFLVQWILDPQRNGILMVVNPFGDATSHFCAFQGATISDPDPDPRPVNPMLWLQPLLFDD